MEFFILLSLNHHIRLLATLLDSVFLEHTLNSIIRHVTTVYTVINVAQLPKVKNIPTPPRGTMTISGQLKCYSVEN